MTKIDEFLKKVEKENKEQLFRLYRFYKNPKDSLGGDDDQTIENYYEFGDIKYFVLNNTFFEFLDICLRDKTFKEKLNLNLLRKLRFLLFDSIDFKNEYFEPLEDEYLRDFCKGKVPCGAICSKKYSTFELFGIVQHYKRFGWIYEIGVGKEKLDNLNVDLIDKLKRQNTLDLEIYHEKYIEPELQRKTLLNSIMEDDYKDTFNSVLASRSAHDRKIFLNLVCDNEFTVIVETELLNKDLPNKVIENIIEIIEMSSNFKRIEANKYENFWFYYNQLKDKISVYNYKKAESLIPLLKRKLNKKIIKLRIY